ncbi:hypothetical protein MHIR_DE00595 [Candidatus Doolittlea endobia]|uniref:Uncharacterized protein n=1 Tax=Candidatus Doolittlea endobia TaxID=1778262 RepID=A0A143WSV9_9ENTR|nr:hypothetical protein MHIR_DE00595 [Candidatus Doolittlea endobia]
MDAQGLNTVASTSLRSVDLIYAVIYAGFCLVHCYKNYDYQYHHRGVFVIPLMG